MHEAVKYRVCGEMAAAVLTAAWMAKLLLLRWQ